MEIEGRRGPGRPRSPEADRAILEATIALLFEVGYRRLTIEAVAARAGVGKTTIYRRHPSKIALVMAAQAADRDSTVPDLDTGSFRGDLLALGEHMVLRLATWGKVLPGILSEAQDDPEVARAVGTQFVWRRQVFGDIVDRAVARGEVGPDTDAELVFRLMDGPILMELMVLRGPIDTPLIERVVAGVIDGVALH
jgi:AcrR family transcriptional regulator